MGHIEINTTRGKHGMLLSQAGGGAQIPKAQSIRHCQGEMTVETMRNQEDGAGPKQNL